MTTSPAHSTRKVAGIALGVALGVLAFAALRGRASILGVALPDHFGHLAFGYWLIFSGISRLFQRAAFPKRFPDTGSERLRQAVIAAAQVVGGFGAVLENTLGVSLLVLAAAAIILTVLRFPRRFFGSSPV